MRLPLSQNYTLGHHLPASNASLGTGLGTSGTIPLPYPPNPHGEWGTAETLALLQLLAMFAVPLLKFALLKIYECEYNVNDTTSH
jgi:hypothetical protein